MFKIPSPLSPFALSLFALATVAPITKAAEISPDKFARTEGIEWKYGSFESALQSSAQKSGLTMIYFWADGSEFCGKLYTETLSKAAAATATKGIVCYSAKHSNDTVKLFERYSVRTLPTILFVRADGSPEDVITGFIPVEDFGTQIARIKKADGTRSGIQGKLEAMDPVSIEALETRWLLIGKLQELGLSDAEAEQTAKLLELDPTGSSTPGGTLKLNALINEIFSPLAELEDSEAEEAMRKADFSPLYNFIKSCKNREVRFDAWSRIARFESRRQNYSAARDAIAKSIHDVKKENLAGWCNSVAGWVVSNADQLSSKERKYALSLAQKAVKLTKSQRKLAKNKKDENEELSDELSNDTLAQRMCVLAQVEFMNRKRDKAKKSIAEAGRLVKDEGLAKEIAEVAHKFTEEK